MCSDSFNVDDSAKVVRVAFSEVDASTTALLLFGSDVGVWTIVTVVGQASLAAIKGWPLVEMTVAVQEIDNVLDEMSVVVGDPFDNVVEEVVCDDEVSLVYLRTTSPRRKEGISICNT